MDYIITARCANNHEQNMIIDGLLGYEWVKEIADLLDGTSKLFKSSPKGTSSLIGKCGLCKAELMCRVSATTPGDLEKILKEKDANN